MRCPPPLVWTSTHFYVWCSLPLYEHLNTFWSKNWLFPNCSVKQSQLNTKHSLFSLIASLSQLVSCTLEFDSSVGPTCSILLCGVPPSVFEFCAVSPPQFEHLTKIGHLPANLQTPIRHLPDTNPLTFLVVVTYRPFLYSESSWGSCCDNWKIKGPKKLWTWKITGLNDCLVPKKC